MSAIQSLFFLLSLTTCYAANTPVDGSIKAGGFHIQYSETGAGEPLVFVHGGTAPVMPKLNTIQKPVLLISGDQDVPFNNTITNYMHTQIASPRVHIIKNAAHMVNMEQPDLFISCCWNFLSNE